MLNIQVENVRVKIEQDDLCFNPREDFDNLGTMVYAHRSYDLGDKSFDTDLYNGWDEVKKGEVPKGAVVLPLYLYDHSGITMNTTGFHCRWDSGQVGFIYAEREKIREWFGVKRVTKKVMERALQCLVGEVETFDQYISGDIYWVKVEDGEHEESCGGFFGHDFKGNGVYDFIAENVLDENVLSEISKQL